MGKRNLKTIKGRDKKNTALQLKKLRNKIDQFDYQMLRILFHRFKITQEIARLKNRLGMPIFQKTRWNELMADRLYVTQTRFYLDSKFTKKLFQIIHREALRIQRQVKNSAP